MCQFYKEAWSHMDEKIGRRYQTVPSNDHTRTKVNTRPTNDIFIVQIEKLEFYSELR